MFLVNKGSGVHVWPRVHWSLVTTRFNITRHNTQHNKYAGRTQIRRPTHKKHSICRPHGKATIVVLFPSWQKFMICNINCQNHTGFSLFVLVKLCKYVFVVWMYWKLGFHCNCTCFDAFLSSIFFYILLALFAHIWIPVSNIKRKEYIFRLDAHCPNTGGGNEPGRNGNYPPWSGHYPYIPGNQHEWRYSRWMILYGTQEPTLNWQSLFLFVLL